MAANSVTAAVTSENQGFLGAEAFARMPQGAALILLSRAAVVDFPALMDAVRSGHIMAASDDAAEGMSALRLRMGLAMPRRATSAITACR